MEFNERLQELRKQKGLTQEELAKELYVSRTAVSKWESGRGYPGIESLKMIAKFFSVTIDELLSSSEAITLAEEDEMRIKSHTKDLAFGLLDVAMVLLLFLPLFASRVEGAVAVSSLIALAGVSVYLKASLIALVILSVCYGVVSICLRGCQGSVWLAYKSKMSLGLSAVCVMVFTVTLHPYAAVFTFSTLVIKVIMLLKK